MITGTPHSFKWRLVRWLVLFETAAISLVIAIAVGLLWATGYLIDGYENGNIDVLTDAIVRDGQKQPRGPGNPRAGAAAAAK